MNMLDRTDHSRFAREHAARLADKYIPATDRDVARTDNLAPEPVAVPATLLINGVETLALTDGAGIVAYADAALADIAAITAATAQADLVKAFIADNPVIQTADEAQKAATWIEATRKTLAALEDERKPKVDPLNTALTRINGAYRIVREPLESMLAVLRARWNKWDAAERQRREAAAAEARRQAEEAARIAAEAAARADEAIAGAEVGECADVGEAVVEAQQTARAAGKLEHAADRAERNTNVRVASSFGGKALSSRQIRVIVIDDPCAAIKAIGLTDKIADAIRQSAKAFEEAHGELPQGTHADYERSI